jgi:hypothetical protein
LFSKFLAKQESFNRSTASNNSSSRLAGLDNGSNRSYASESNSSRSSASSNGSNRSSASNNGSNRSHASESNSSRSSASNNNQIKIGDDHYVNHERNLYLFDFKTRFNELFKKHIPYSYRLETIKVINKECEREIRIVKDELQAFCLGQYHKTEKNRAENAQKDFEEFFDKTLTARRKKKHVEKKKDKDDFIEYNEEDYEEDDYSR